MPPPPELAGWVDLFVWGAILFIVVVVAVALAEYLFRWLRTSPPVPTQAQAPVSAAESEALKELMHEIRALREEIRELRRELRE